MKPIKGTFEGYLWWSDQQQPEVHTKEKPTTDLLLNEDENPFIIEGQLYDSQKGYSVSIKYVDGKYIVNEYDMKSDFAGDKVETAEHLYRGYKMKGLNLLFKELWEPKEDPPCCDMEVLRATKVAFVGFEKEKNNNNLKQ
jgi:CRISPR type III-associated protein (TIGR04423 family)